MRDFCGESGWMDANGCRGAMNEDGSVVVKPHCARVFETFPGIKVERREDD